MLTILPPEHAEAVPQLRMKPPTATDLRVMVVQTFHRGYCGCAVCEGTPTMAELRFAEADIGRPGSSFVWLGVGKQRMHLTVEQARELSVLLTRWADTGSFVAGEASANG